MTGGGEIKDKLRRASVRNGDKRAQVFIPIGALQQICSHGHVKEELRQSCPGWSHDYIDACARHVCHGQLDTPYTDNSMIKIFAILVLIDEVSNVGCFVRNGIKDRDLPFSLNPADGGRTLVRRGPGLRVPGSREWARALTDEFLASQWQVLAPIFVRPRYLSVTIQYMESDVVMPWLEKTTGCKPDRYSVVDRVVIHPEHHNFVRFPEMRHHIPHHCQGPCGQFVLKTLYSCREDDFKKELANLNRCASKKHLVELYAAMKHGEEYSFLFPWAAGGPLSSLWGRDSLAWCRDDEVADRSVRTINAVRWLAQQCYGLVSQEGLGFVHNSMAGPPYMHTVAGDGFGIHGNIKPDNVLHFSQEPNEYNAGALKISNTGLIGFNTMNSRSEPSSNAYRAPEHGKRGRHQSCKYDIWSLGCVFSELLPWFIFGPDGVKQYNSKRFNDIHPGQPYVKEDHFFHLVSRRPDNAILKPSVSKVRTPLSLYLTRSPMLIVQGLTDGIKWMEHLRQTVGEGNFLHDFLTYVEDRMLEVDDGVRVSSKDVSDFLGAKFQMCRDDNHKEHCTPKQLLLHVARPRRSNQIVTEQGAHGIPRWAEAQRAPKRRRLT